MLDSSLTWHPYKSEWLLSKNNMIVFKRKQKQPEKLKGIENLKNKKTSFFFSNRKPETKGSLIYTPDGYGIIQDIDTFTKKFSVKINNKIAEYSNEDIVSDIPITLRFVSSSVNHDDKITVPVYSTSSDLVEKIEASVEGGSSFSTKIFFKGREMVKATDSLEKLGIYPDSKIMVLSSLGKPFLVNRFVTVNQGWGYSNSCDGITFSASKEIAVMGFGIYSSETEKTSLNCVAKFIQGNDAKNPPIFSKDIVITKDENDPENKIFRFYFDKPYKVKSGDSYSCVIEIRSGNSHYGSSGTSTVTGESDVVFSFTDCSGSVNGTSCSSGQIPEVYYFV